MAFVRARQVNPDSSTSSWCANYLSPCPRPIHQFFDDDGPGQKASAGPRHNNDHIYIKDIQILPTTDEILAVDRPPYMPRKNLTEPHSFEHTYRLLDTLFRHLRYDSTEAIRDICYSAAQKLAYGASDCPNDYEIKQETTSRNRYCLYHGAIIEEVLAHEQKGMLVRVSFLCPAYLRGRSMHSSGRFEGGMLCALIRLDDNEELTTTFFEVVMSQSTHSMDGRGGNGIRAAVQLSFAGPARYDDVLQISGYAQRLFSGRFVLIEFPKTLYVGFYWCLKRLQEMQIHDLAFTNYIAPRLSPDALARHIHVNLSAGRTSMPVLPPAYSQQDGFSWDISSLTGANSTFPPNDVLGSQRDAFLSVLSHDTTLDEDQATAFYENLTREFSFTQGPPGTGKTYLGVALARAILASRKGPNPKPILIVCLTNHALDSFLADLRDAGISGLVRLGNKSKEEWTNAINLKELSRKTRLSDNQWKKKNASSRRAQSLFTSMDSWCKGLNAQNSTGNLSWHTVATFLEDTYPEVYQQLVSTTENPYARAFAFDYWAGGGDLKNLQHLHMDLKARLNDSAKDQCVTVTEKSIENILAEIGRHTRAHSAEAGSCSVWNIPLADRKQLISKWNCEMDRNSLARKLSMMHLDHQKACKDVQAVYDGRHAATILQNNVVGMTTTACARHWDMLRSLDLEVVICEEAGEVIEAHTICSLFPSIQHAIFIGDPLQLRPEVAEQAMSLETKLGAHYRLDESLFERCMTPTDPAARVMPTSRLNVQRRMHPEIADITRLTYPDLKDHESTRSHLPTYGISKRIFWLDHRIPESEPGCLSNSHSNSRSNSHEALMVLSLVQYLLRGNAYALGDIAVLTPYNGQLAQLRNGVQATCQVYLSPKDKEALIDEGLIQEDHDSGSKSQIPMSEMLRVATIDNFQGEEAKIVILSTVRSGKGAGFLKTVNRANVACSRARDGYYIIGNSSTLSQVPMWRSIVEAFSKNNNLGPSLRTCCTRHPDHHFDVRYPEDFHKIRDCEMVCGEKLDCGHECDETCHAPNIHKKIPCAKPCVKTLPCGHACTKLCYEDCGQCEYPMEQRLLSCGHAVDTHCSGETPKCQFVLDHIVLPCRHQVSLRCSETDKPRVCDQHCGARLPCGHECEKRCAENHVGRTHPPCISLCNSQLACGHSCKAYCHAGRDCPPCTSTCRKSCVHGSCGLACNQVCDPCVQTHQTTCIHQEKTEMLCCLPSDLLPCCESCDKVLSCGHRCPSLCSEPCPTAEECPQCVTGFPSANRVIVVPLCRHQVRVETLDAQFASQCYHIDENGKIIAIKFHVNGLALKPAVCFCGEKLTGVKRYAMIDQLLAVPDVVDRLLAKIRWKMRFFSDRVTQCENELAHSFDDFCNGIRTNPLAAKMNRTLISRRGSALLQEMKGIAKFRDDVVVPCQASMVKLHGFLPAVTAAYQLVFALRCDALENRARFALVSNDLRMARALLQLTDPSNEVQRLAQVLWENAMVECIQSTAACHKAINNASRAHGPCLEVEFRLQQVLFNYLADEALLKHQRASIARMNPGATAASLAIALDLCRKYPSSAGLFRTVAEQLKNHSRHHSLTSISRMYGTTAGQLQRAWSTHVLGQLKVCNEMHPYSAEAFHDGCPECGKRVKLPDEEFASSATHLFENKFLEHMNNSQTSSLSSG